MAPPIMWNDDEEAFEVVETVCCDEPMYDTGCDAKSCKGYACEQCGVGCDIEFQGNGRCAREIAAEDPEEFNARVNREPAAFGLGPVGGGGS